MSNSVLGVELDGSRATVVEVVEGFAVSTRSIVGDSALDALTLALAGQKANVPVRISLVSAGTNMRPIDVTPECLTRKGFEAQVYKAIPVPPENTTAAGIFFADPSELHGDILAPGIAVVAPEPPVLEAYKFLGKRPGEVVAPVLTLEGFDGIHLAVRWSNADVTLVSGGRVTSYRQLRVGGLSALEAIMGGRLDNLLSGTGAPDLAAEAELQDYLRVLAAEARQTIEYWERSQDALGTEVIVFGAGAGAPGLDEALQGAGLTRAKSDDMAKHLTYIPLQERPAAVGAFLAGRTYSTHLPQSVFPNPFAEARAAAARKSAKQARTLAIVAGVIVALLAIFLGPVAAGRLNVSNAENELLEAQGRLAAVQEQRDDIDRLAGTRSGYEQVAQSDPRWSALMASLYSSAQPGSIEFTTLNMQSVGPFINVIVTAEAPTGDYEVLTSWMDRLQADLQAQSLVPSSFENVSEAGVTRSSFSLSFSIPAELVVDPTRSLEAATPAAEAPTASEDN